MTARDRPAEELALLLGTAGERGRRGGLRYAGVVTPSESWRLFAAEQATIVDVRTRPEWEFVGRVPDSVLIPWRAYGEAEPDPRFVERLRAHFEPEDILLFLCRSAVRSHHAAEAAARAGFRRAFNIAEGFEGDHDALGRRGQVGGWRRAGLPWIQD